MVKFSLNCCLIWSDVDPFNRRKLLILYQLCELQQITYHPFTRSVKQAVKSTKKRHKILEFLRIKAQNCISLHLPSIVFSDNLPVLIRSSFDALSLSDSAIWRTFACACSNEWMGLCPCVFICVFLCDCATWECNENEYTDTPMGMSCASFVHSSLNERHRNINS